MSYMIAILHIRDEDGQVLTWHKPAEFKTQVTAVMERELGKISTKGGVLEALGGAFDEVERELALRTVGIG